MSSTLVWRKIIVVPANNSLPDQLKYILRKRFGGGNYPEILDRTDLRYLEGLADAGVDGAEDLRAAIIEYDEVEILEEY